MSIICLSNKKIKTLAKSYGLLSYNNHFMSYLFDNILQNHRSRANATNSDISLNE